MVQDYLNGLRFTNPGLHRTHFSQDPLFSTLTVLMALGVPKLPGHFCLELQALGPKGPLGLRKKGPGKSWIARYHAIVII